MARVPTPYDLPSEVPDEVLKFVRGSNNGTRAALRLYQYPDGQFCLQIEDQVGGGEMWLDADALHTLGEELLHRAIVEQARQAEEG